MAVDSVKGLRVLAVIDFKKGDIVSVYSGKVGTGQPRFSNPIDEKYTYSSNYNDYIVGISTLQFGKGVGSFINRVNVGEVKNCEIVRHCSKPLFYLTAVKDITASDTDPVELLTVYGQGYRFNHNIYLE